MLNKIFYIVSSLLLIIILPLFTFSSCSKKDSLQNQDTLKSGADTEKKLIPFRKGNKWGYSLPAKNGDAKKEIIIECKYDNAMPFKNGIAEVSLNNKYGLINIENKEIIPLKYDKIGEKIDELIAVKINDKWGFSDTAGKEVVPVKYDIVRNAGEGLIMVCIANKPCTKCGYIDKKGTEVIPLIYEDSKVWFREGLVAVKFNRKWGLINKAGNTIISFKYDDIRDFKKGPWAVRSGKKWGFIDKEGKVVIPFIYDDIEASIIESGEFVQVCINKKWGSIRDNGDIDNPLEYDYPLIHLPDIDAIEHNGDIQEGQWLSKFVTKNRDYISISVLEKDLAEVKIREITGNKIIYRKIGYIDINGTEYWEE